MRIPGVDPSNESNLIFLFLAGMLQYTSSFYSFGNYPGTLPGNE